jgi:hypothetical protein
MNTYVPHVLVTSFEVCRTPTECSTASEYTALGTMWKCSCAALRLSAWGRTQNFEIINARESIQRNGNQINMKKRDVKDRVTFWTRRLQNGNYVHGKALEYCGVGSKGNRSETSSEIFLTPAGRKLEYLMNLHAHKRTNLQRRKQRSHRNNYEIRRIGNCSSATN